MHPIGSRYDRFPDRFLRRTRHCSSKTRPGAHSPNGRPIASAGPRRRRRRRATGRRKRANAGSRPIRYAVPRQMLNTPLFAESRTLKCATEIESGAVSTCSASLRISKASPQRSRGRDLCWFCDVLERRWRVRRPEPEFLQSVAVEFLVSSSSWQISHATH